MTNHRMLIINAGSSSLKCDVISLPDGNRQAWASIERMGTDNASLSSHLNQSHQITSKKPKDLLAQAFSCMQVDPTTLTAAAHRVVHGGKKYTQATLINHQMIEDLNAIKQLAPLHNPTSVAFIKHSLAYWPDLPQVACFDTAFHSTLAEPTYRYALPDQCYEQYHIRQYGFHGLSHNYVSQIAIKQLHLAKQHGLIVAHLGNGCSVCAIKDGQSVNTSMGFTPLDGLMMGTRSGHLDPNIIFYLARNHGYHIDDIDHMLHHQSGCLGISGISHDMRDLAKASQQGNSKAKLAIDMFCQKLAQGIGQMMTSLDRLDALIFTGGIGENSALIREQTITQLPILKQLKLTPKILVIPTNESLQMARETQKVLSC
ncbi:acetate/propionate family kinase [Gammaproteobacteria bacterium]|nr:acetate/propionate family kinase [Gammaproteobacteria bacterium]